jgi:hypothetical protein
MLMSPFPALQANQVGHLVCTGCQVSAAASANGYMIMLCAAPNPRADRALQPHSGDPDVCTWRTVCQVMFYPGSIPSITVLRLATMQTAVYAGCAAGAMSLTSGHGPDRVQLPCRCALCNNITQVAQSNAAFTSPQPKQPAKPVQTVIVQHPDDEQGNQQIAVGVVNG